MWNEDAKFPGQSGDGIPPSPSRENPGQVYPKSDPQAAPSPVPGGNGSPSLLGNPYLLEEPLHKLEVALGNVIDILERERKVAGGSSGEANLVQKMKNWRNEVSTIRATKGRDYTFGHSGTSAEAGGMFAD
ncbi:hypothetical protein BJ138DRAFT_1085944 [Hygrophoropsis aurantiaca]|uniref:Uncharacterized protein n=1 Tax=Hygrophoropsis aurantiaca TaxID=72124 RepID=A0ACB8ADH9_9AGAM|nr:hypothetical protein BJ138DRAFT_1085944 [Hygrophoropsis aurantiaca]